MPYYAVRKGKIEGIFTTWSECQKSINGYSGAIYKKFTNKNDAEQFISGKLFVSNRETVKIKIKREFIPNLYVYTDGSCSKNGKIGAQAGLGVYFGENDPRNLSKKVEGKQTNNVAEILAIIEAYNILENIILNDEKIMICSDSQYAINCCTTYGEKCDKNNWQNEIPNKDLVQKAYNIFKDLNNIKFKHIPAHTGKTDIHSIGNYHADRLANEAIGVLENVKPSNRIYLNVAYKDKDFAKVCGARWDNFKKKWYISENLDEKNRELIFAHFEKLIE